MTTADFAPGLATPRTIQAWVSFWAEAQSRPAYDALYGDEEAEYLATLEAMCEDLRTPWQLSPPRNFARRCAGHKCPDRWFVDCTWPFARTTQPGAGAAGTACMPRLVVSRSF
jgi:hypothetical protein